MTKRRSERDYFKLSPEEKEAYDLLAVDSKSKASAKLLTDSIIEYKKMLRQIFNKTKETMEIFNDDS